MNRDHDPRTKAKAARYALNPKTPSLALQHVPPLVKSILIDHGRTREEAGDLAERLGRKLAAEDFSPETILNHEASDFGAKRDEASRVCAAVLYSQAWKFASGPNRVWDLILTALKSPLACFENVAQQDRYRLGWHRLVVSSTEELPSPNMKRASQLFDSAIELGLHSSGARAFFFYMTALQHCGQDSSDEQRKKLLSVSERTNIPMAVVIESAMYGEGSEARSRRKQYSILEFPLPLVRPVLSAAEIVETLTNEFPWMTPAIAAIGLDLMVSQHYQNGVMKITPKLLYGPPGSGKTSFVARVADLLGQPNAILSAAGSGSARILVGTPRGWNGSRPCFPLEILSQHKMPNAVLCCDEIDKEASADHNGRFTDGLLGFVEPTTAYRYYDEYVFSKCNLSHISWLATANDLSRISAPVKSRFDLIACGQPRPEHTPQIVIRTVDNIRREYGLDAETEILDGQAQSEILVSRTGSAREISRLVRTKFGETLQRRFATASGQTLAAQTLPASRIH